MGVLGITGEDMVEYKPYIADPNKFTRLSVKLPERHKEQLIPTVEQQKDIAKFLMYNGLWVALTYSADLIGMVLPWLGKGIRQLIKWRFKGKWEQKEIGIDL